MKFRSTYILFGLVVLVLGFLVYKIVSGGKKDETDWLFPEFHDTKDATVKDDDVKNCTVRITRAGKPTVIYECKDGTWSMTEPYKLRVNSFKLKNFVLGLFNAKKEKADTEGIKNVGLDEPGTIIAVNADDRSLQLNVGDQTEAKKDKEVYVSPGSHPKDIARIKYTVVQDAFNSYNQLRDSILLGVHTSNCSYVALEPGKDAGEYKKMQQALSLWALASIEQTKAAAFDLCFAEYLTSQAAPRGELVVAADDVDKNKWSYRQPDDYGRADWKGDTPAAERFPLPDKGVDNVYKLVQDIELLNVGDVDRDFIAEGVSEADLKAKYGLDAKSPETLKITVKRKKETKEEKKPKFGVDASSSSSGSAPVEYEELSLLIGKMALEPKAPPKTDEAKEDKKSSASKSSSSPEEKPQEMGYYAALSTEPGNVVWLPAEKINPILELTANRSALRDRNLTALDRDKIDHIRVRLADGSEWHLLRAGKEKHWRMERLGDPIKKADDATVNNLINSIAPPQDLRGLETRLISGFPDEKDTKDVGLDKPSTEIWFWEDDVENLDDKGSASGSGSANASGSGSASASSSSSASAGSGSSSASGSASSSASGSKSGSGSASGSASAEKEKDILELHLKLKNRDKPKLKLAFGIVKDNNLYIRRSELTDKDKERTGVVTIPSTASLATAHKDGPLAYLDRTIPPFYTVDPKDPIENRVTKLTMTQGQDTFELTKQKDGDKTAWKITAPKQFGDRVVANDLVTRMLQDFNKPMLPKLIREKAEDLKSYDLDPPTYKVVITVKEKDDKTQDVTYNLGKDAEIGNLYFTTSQRDGVFSAARYPRNDLEEVFFQVAKVDLNNVKSIKMTGWKKGTSTTTIEAERNFPNNYETKGSGMQLDGEKLERFLSANVRSLQAKKVLLSGGPKADDKMFKPAEGGFELEITFKDTTAPLKLAIGAPYDKSGIKGYQALASALPNLVFIIDDEPWKPVLEGANYFAR